MAKKKKDSVIKQVTSAVGNIGSDFTNRVIPPPTPQFVPPPQQVSQDETTKDKPSPTSNINKTYTDVGTGKPSGFDYKDETYFGAKPSEILKAQQDIALRNAPTEQLLAQKQLQEQQARGVELAKGLGQINPNIAGTPESSGVDKSQLISVGLGNVLPSAIGFGAAGAGAGLLGGPAAPVTVPTGAIIGLVAGAV